jgi:uncharacterized protein with von Willebrand factor type A (vWA) domain
MFGPFSMNPFRMSEPFDYPGRSSDLANIVADDKIYEELIASGTTVGNLNKFRDELSDNKEVSGWVHRLIEEPSFLKTGQYNTRGKPYDGDYNDFDEQEVIYCSFVGMRNLSTKELVDIYLKCSTYQRNRMFHELSERQSEFLSTLRTMKKIKSSLNELASMSKKT